MTSNLDYDPTTLKPITEEMLSAHPHLTADDSCYYIDEYPKAVSFKDHDGKSRIYNLKIKPSQQHRLRYKRKAIRHYGEILSNLIGDAQAFIAPAPSSKVQQDPEFDDRLTRVANDAKDNFGTDVVVCNIFETTCPRDSFHENERRRDINELKNSISCNKQEIQSLIQQGCRRLILLDDMITTGCTFCACRDLFLEALRELGEENQIEFFGVFLSRRVPAPPTNPFTDFDIDDIL